VGAVLRSKRCALYRYQVADDPIGPDWLVANRTASAQMDQHQQHPYRQRQTHGRPGSPGWSGSSRRAAR
jgi:hypothetical protein